MSNNLTIYCTLGWTFKSWGLDFDLKMQATSLCHAQGFIGICELISRTYPCMTL